MQQQDYEVVKAQRDGLKRKLAEQNRWAMRPTATWLSLIGIAILVFWYLTKSGSAMSMVVFLAGITLLSLAVLLYFMSPARFLRAEVSDGEVLGNTTNVGKILSGMLIEAKGVHVPASQAGELKVFIPASDGQRIPFEAMKASGGIFILPKDGARGILLNPPGYGLMRQARQIGISFSDAGLENELKDVLEKGMELASVATVKRTGDEVHVSLTNLANTGLCQSIRKEQPGLCTQIGCPICSFIACAIVEGTGFPVRIKTITVEGNVLRTTFELLEGTDLL